ncbi:TPA: hypothetical protein DEO28_03665 [Candidatus Dependentiae bacterium]|nr:hypothetical protein [Candidatus Dependentiae bacterium]HBZ73579.1 hypothetical protein [Candidatus Dependentiae bacterium]
MRWSWGGEPKRGEYKNVRGLVLKNDFRQKNAVPLRHVALKRVHVKPMHVKPKNEGQKRSVPQNL